MSRTVKLGEKVEAFSPKKRSSIYVGKGSRDSYVPCSNCESKAKRMCSKCRQLFYCSAQCAKTHYLKRHLDECIDFRQMKLMISVKKSMRHGNGVFAACNIPVNTRVCFFDYKVKMWNLDFKFSRSNGTKSAGNADCFFGNMARFNPDYDRCMYLYPVSDIYDQAREIYSGYVLEGHFKKVNPFGIGYLINDGACVNIAPDTGNFETIQNEVIKYNILTSVHRNVQIDDNFWFVTTRCVKKGDELLTSYGDQYWLHRLLLHSKNHTKRFIYSRMMDSSMSMPDQLEEKTIKAFLDNVVRVPEQLYEEHKTVKNVLQYYEDNLMHFV